MSSKVSGTSDTDGPPSGISPSGEFIRGISTCREWIGPDSIHTAETDRYHLYVGINCPWCHRVILARAVLGLQSSITMDVCFPSRTDEPDDKGRVGLWQFAPNGITCRNNRHTTFPECTSDTVFGKSTIVEIYDDLGIEQKSVPILLDKKTRTIVSNESADIVRMLSENARALGSSLSTVPDLYPTALQKTIDESNEWIYHTINNGAYKAGFTGSQDAYEDAYEKYFSSLDRLNVLFATQQFVAGDVVTEADIRLFPTLFRHDPVYYSRFKLSRAKLFEYPHIWRWMGTMIASVPGVQECATKSILQHCKQGYFGRTGSNTIPVGPEGYPECITDGTDMTQSKRPRIDT